MLSPSRLPRGATLVLSLGNWPNEPFVAKQIHFTPFTRRLITQTGIKVNELMPMDFKQFASNKQMDESLSSLQQEYKTSEERRIKQIRILVQMRKQLLIHGATRMSSAYKKQASIYQSRKSFADFAKSTRMSQKSLARRSSNSQFAKMSVKNSHREIERTSHTSTNIVDQYYGNTKSVSQQKLMYSPKTHSTIYEKQVLTVREKAKQQFNVALSLWKQMNDSHARELKELGKKLSPKQKKRLFKMQDIEKNKLQQKMRSLSLLIQGNK